MGVPKDRAYIDGLIQARGGYDRLDKVVAGFRSNMMKDLAQFLRDSQVLVTLTLTLTFMLRLKK